MGDEERKSLDAKIDIILMQLAEIKQDRKDCRIHCDSTTGVVFERMNDLTKHVNQIIGSKVQPYWVYVAIGIIGILVGALGMKGIH